MSRTQDRDDTANMVTVLQNLLAIGLWRGGLSQDEIRERLGVRKATVNRMLKGLNRELYSRNPGG